MSTPFGIIGRGWSFPPAFRRPARTADMLTDVDDINSSLEVLLATAIGQRVMQASYGCDLREFIFEPLTTTLKTFMADKIKTALLLFEPRITVNEVKVNADEELEGRILIAVEYIVKTTNNRYNYVYDYYLTEGAELKIK